MKLSVFFIAVVATTLAAASSTTHAADCDPKLVDAVNIPEQEKCETESGFRFIPLTIPTDDVKAKFCKSDACLTIWKAAKSAAPEECLIKGKELYAEILTPLNAACKKAGMTGNVTSKTDHGHGGGSKDSHDHAHGAGMGKKNKTTSHHGSGSEDSSDDDSAVKAPGNSTKPTTAPNSAGASPLSITAGVAALSLAAAAFL